MTVKIKRRQSPDSESYWQSFEYNGNPDASVASVLEYLNYNDDLKDINGNPARRIIWECGCMQKMCGGCAMLINHSPALACNTFLRDLKCDVLLLEPLTKFPVIADLMTDRSIIQENLKKADMYLHGQAEVNKSEYSHTYLAAKCLMCGLCLEVCPNYVKGGNFFGASYANSAYLYRTVSSDKTEIQKEYKKHFESGCSKALSCQTVCPMKIPTLSSMAKMNKRIK